MHPAFEHFFLAQALSGSEVRGPAIQDRKQVLGSGCGQMNTGLNMPSFRLMGHFILPIRSEKNKPQ